MDFQTREYRQPRAGEIAAFLSCYANDQKAYGDELRFRPCPCCNADNRNNPSIQINVKTGLWRCFRCNEVGNWFQLTKAFGHPLSEGDRYKDPVIRVYDQEIIRKFMNEVRRPVHDGHYPELLEYCLGRGIGVETLRDWRVSSKGAKCLRWPLYDLIDGKWTIVNIKVRSIDPNSQMRDWFDIRGGATDLLLGNHLIDLDGPKRAIIFEGQWDVMAAWQCGLRNVFSLPNGATNINVASMLRFIPNDWEIILAVDMDAAGNLAAEKFYAQLGLSKVKRLKLPFKDLNEWLMNEPFLDEKEIMSTLSTSNDIYVNQVTDNKTIGNFIKIDMSIDIKDTHKIIASYPWDQLNEKFGGGLYEGETTSILGASGSGKTTWVNQVGIAIASSGVSVGLMSFEESRSALMIKLQNTIKSLVAKDNYSTVQERLYLSELSGHEIADEALLLETEAFIKNGCRIIIVDNLDHICGNSSDRKNNLFKRLVRIANETNSHIICVFQPNKIEKGKLINSYNQKGFSSDLQDSPNYCNINRIGNGQLRLEIEKARFKGVMDGENTVFFDWDTDKRIYVDAPEKRFTKDQRMGKLISLVSEG
jgi:archaellum biogenesis ATPase FlaH/5S rRNA maturation endonuclease (ribonuclease M5)